MGDKVPVPEDWSDREAVKAWLRTQPRNVGAALAVRAALRVVPLVLANPLPNRVGGSLQKSSVRRAASLLPTLRAASAAWVNAIHTDATVRRFASIAASSAYEAAATFAFGSVAEIAHAIRAAAEAAYAGSANYEAAGPDAAEAGIFYSQEAIEAAYYNSIDSDMELNSNLKAENMAKQLMLDASYVEVLAGSQVLCVERLWTQKTPEWVEDIWRRVSSQLVKSDENWGVWTEWYDDRLFGKPPDMALETKRVVEPKKWREGPSAVNAEIAAIIAAHESEKAPRQPAGSGWVSPLSVAQMIAAPVLQSAYADFVVDQETSTVRMVPMPGDVPVLADADLVLDWRSRLEGLSVAPLALVDDIREAGRNVPPSLLKDLTRYGDEADRGPGGVRPGVLDLFGRHLVAAGENEDITGPLGTYLGPKLKEIGAAHRRLMRDYHAQVTSRLNSPVVALPAEATSKAVAEVIAVVSANLKVNTVGGFSATRDFTDLLDTQREAFAAAAAAIDLATDAAQRDVINKSVAADKVATLATIGRFYLRVKEAVGSQSTLARRIGYFSDLAGAAELAKPHVVWVLKQLGFIP